jgi:hypothetical protein
MKGLHHPGASRTHQEQIKAIVDWIEEKILPCPWSSWIWENISPKQNCRELHLGFSSPVPILHGIRLNASYEYQVAVADKTPPSVACQRRREPK